MADRLIDALTQFRMRVRSLDGSAQARARARSSALLSAAATGYLARLDPDVSASRRFSRTQYLWLGGAAAITAALLFLTPQSLLVGLNALVMLHVLAVTAVRLVGLAICVREPRPPLIQPPYRLDDKDLPVISVLCPVYREADSLPNLVSALTAIDYPREKLDVKIVVEEDDAPTLATARQLAARVGIDVVSVPMSEPRTKPKACNYALWTARGSLLVIYDAEDRPAPNQLRRAADAFATLPDDVACLQARLNYYNRDESWLTRLFAAEYALIFDIVLPGLARIGAPLPLGGTSNIFRTDILIGVGAWDPFNVTEDADIGLRLGAAGYKTAMLDATTLEEATSSLGPWFRQRTRWIKGYMQTWAVHSRRPRADWRQAVTLHLLVGGVVTAALVNPILWTAYLLWITGVADLGWLFPGPLGPLATFAFLSGNLVLLWLYMIAPLRRRWHDLVPWALTAPAYWVLQSVAGYRALWQFIRAPHRWEKTHHKGDIQLEAIDARDLQAAG